MSEKSLATFKAISCFLRDLNKLFDQNKPLALYKHLVSKITFMDEEHIEKHNNIFREFLKDHRKAVMDRDIPKDMEIIYRDKPRICVELGRFWYRANSQTQDIIRKHLLTICAYIYPEEEVFDKLKETENVEMPDMSELGIDSSTREGAFVGGIMQKVQGVAKTTDANNPAELLGAVLGSGIFTELTNGLQESEKGGLEPQKLFGVLQGALGGLMGAVPSNDTTTKPKVEEIEETQDAENPGKIEEMD